MREENINSERVCDELKRIQKEIHDGALFIVGNSKDITALQEWQVRQNGSLGEIQNHLRKIEGQIGELTSGEIADLKVEIARGKPSWATTVIIAFLSSVTVGAIVFALSSL